jgi:hypothetical protein
MVTRGLLSVWRRRREPRHQSFVVVSEMRSCVSLTLVSLQRCVTLLSAAPAAHAAAVLECLPERLVYHVLGHTTAPTRAALVAHMQHAIVALGSDGPAHPLSEDVVRVRSPSPRLRFPAAPVESSRASPPHPTGRERTGSPTMQTLHRANLAAALALTPILTPPSSI